jgi:hypothetical protein
LCRGKTLARMHGAGSSGDCFRIATFSLPSGPDSPEISSWYQTVGLKSVPFGTDPIYPFLIGGEVVIGVRQPTERQLWRLTKRPFPETVRGYRGRLRKPCLEEKDRQRVLAVLRKHGIARWPDGRRIEQIVQVRGTGYD